MRTLSTAINVARKLLTADKGWVWAVEVARSAAAGGGAYRLCSSTRAVKIGGKWYQPLGPDAMEVSPPPENADGSAGDLVVTLPAVSRLAIYELESRAIIGQTLTLRAAHESGLAAPPEALSWAMTVYRGVAAEGGVRLNAGHPLAFVKVPRRVFDARVAPVFASVGGGGVR